MRNKYVGAGFAIAVILLAPYVIVITSRVVGLDHSVLFFLSMGLLGGFAIAGVPVGLVGLGLSVVGLKQVLAMKPKAKLSSEALYALSGIVVNASIAVWTGTRLWAFYA